MVPISDGMDIKEGMGRLAGLAMAGKSPWGGKKPGDTPDPDKSAGDAVPPAADEPAAEESTPPKPKGPRNPWLPSGNEPRRSANIEDIFKHRGPAGPRRTGGGGPGFRFPERPGGKSWFPVAVAAIVVVWLGFSMIHQVGPKEQAVVTSRARKRRSGAEGCMATRFLPGECSSLARERAAATIGHARRCTRVRTMRASSGCVPLDDPVPLPGRSRHLPP